MKNKTGIVGIVLVYVGLGCSSNIPTKEEPISMAARLQMYHDSVDRAKEDSIALHSRVPRAESPEDLIFNPFGTNPQNNNPISELQGRIRGKVTLLQEKVQNVHQPDVWDILYILYFDSSSIGVYHAVQPDKYFITTANITSPAVQLQSNIRVGMEKKFLMESLQYAKAPVVEQNDLVTVTDPVTGAALLFRIQNERVVKIMYRGFLD